MSKIPPSLRGGERIGDGQWTVVRRIGEGGFAEVYEVKDSIQDTRYALKIEKQDRRLPHGGTLKAELKTMRRLQTCPHVCRLVEGGHGTHDGRYYIVMELLGMNLAQMQRITPGNKWALDAVSTIGKRILNGLEGMHRLGFIHRDVKPANFAVVPRDHPAEAADWRVIDFGITRRFLDDENLQISERMDFNEFRGSTTYASVHAHLKQDLSRRDDLWSWLYMLAEMLDGGLPWRSERVDRDFDAAGKESAKEVALREKQACMQNPQRLTTTVPLPEGLRRISNYLKDLSFEAEPDYGYLSQCLSMSTFAAPPAAMAPPPDMLAGWAAATPLGPAAPQGTEGYYHERREGGLGASTSGMQNGTFNEGWQRPHGFLPQNPINPQLSGGDHHFFAGAVMPPAQFQQHDQPPLDRELYDFVALVKRGWLSTDARAITEQIASLDPAEGIGVIAWLIDRMASDRMDIAGRPIVAAWLQQLAAFTHSKAQALQDARL